MQRSAHTKRDLMPSQLEQIRDQQRETSGQIFLRLEEMGRARVELARSGGPGPNPQCRLGGQLERSRCRRGHRRAGAHCCHSRTEGDGHCHGSF